MVQKIQRLLIYLSLFLLSYSVSSIEYLYQGIGGNNIAIDVKDQVCTVSGVGSDVLYKDESCSEYNSGTVRLFSVLLFIELPLDRLIDGSIVKNKYSDTHIKYLGNLTFIGNTFEGVFMIDVYRNKPFSTKYRLFYSKRYGVIAFTKKGINGSKISPIWFISGKCGFAGHC